ncbi:MAG TPA: hypothetical protein VI997_12490 [Candidatus Thermoplasmatota archaeon]|nr:hypothetical protein [Candidatus Thermoplasmatota archaeon]
MTGHPLLAAFDVLSSASAIGVAAAFAYIWQRSRSGLHLLFFVGFALVGLSFLTVSASQFDRLGEATFVDVIRLAGQTGAALVLFFAYVSGRVHGAVRPWFALAWASAVFAVGAVLVYFVLPPRLAFESPSTFAAAHLVQAIAYAGCTVFSFQGLLRAPDRVGRLLVPIAFLFLFLSKHMWVLIDLSGAEALIPFVYMWRLSGLAFLLAALVIPAQSEGEPPAST